MYVYIKISLAFLLLVGCGVATPTPTTQRLTPATARPTTKPTEVILTGCIEKSSLRVRAGPGTQYDILDGLAVGTCVTAAGRNQDASWLYVVSGDLKGWVAAEYITISGDASSLSYVPNFPFLYDEPPQASLPTQAILQDDKPRPTADLCLDDLLSGVPPEYARCGNSTPVSAEPICDGPPEECSQSNGGGCPDGCTYQKPGCTIKGNISFDTGEKIYHVPGQEYYTATNIDPTYGERWFCTEAEARSNGWRKSFR